MLALSCLLGGPAVADDGALPMPQAAAPPQAAIAQTQPGTGPCRGLEEMACMGSATCHWVRVYGIAPGAPTAGYCRVRAADDADIEMRLPGHEQAPRAARQTP